MYSPFASENKSVSEQRWHCQQTSKTTKTKPGFHGDIHALI